MENTPANDNVYGHVVFPGQWTVFGPVEGVDIPVLPEVLRSLPGALTIEGKRFAPQQVTPVRNQYDFKPLYGAPPYKKPRSVLVCAPLRSAEDQKVTLGVGADWFYRVYVNGEIVLDLMDEGNCKGPPAINNHRIDAWLRQGDNIVVVHLVNGAGGCLLALGGPEELRKGDFKSILPPPDHELDAASRDHRKGGTNLYSPSFVPAEDRPDVFITNEAGSDEHLQEAMPTSLSRSFLKYARGEVDNHRGPTASTEISVNKVAGCTVSPVTRSGNTFFMRKATCCSTSRKTHLSSATLLMMPVKPNASTRCRRKSYGGWGR